MPARLEIEIAETKRFQLDCALYGLSDGAKLQAIAHLEYDPAIGRPRDDKPMLWEWEFSEFSITYAVSGDLSRVVLLELRPRVEQPTRLLARAFDIIDKINKLKRLFGL